MKFNIYNFENEPTEVELKCRAVSRIYVTVITGDETITVLFSNGTAKEFSSSDTRIVDDVNGSYILKGKQIREWINFEPTGEGAISFERMIAFR